MTDKLPPPNRMVDIDVVINLIRLMTPRNGHGSPEHLFAVKLSEALKECAEDDVQRGSEIEWLIRRNMMKTFIENNRRNANDR